MARLPARPTPCPPACFGCSWGPTRLETSLLSQSTGSAAQCRVSDNNNQDPFSRRLEPVTCESLIRAPNATHSTRTARDLCCCIIW